MTTTTLSMLDAYPQAINLNRHKLAATIDTLIACSQACTACADACLSEDMVAELTTCILGLTRFDGQGRCGDGQATCIAGSGLLVLVS
jgi:hypothetical protein